VSVSNGVKEKTEVLYGTENIIISAIEGYSRVKESLDICSDQKGPALFLTTTPIWEVYSGLKTRGIKLRFITEITKDNLSYCKELLKIVELRHMDEVKGNFGVSETQYAANATIQEANQLEQLIVSNVKAFVEQQQYFFDMLWHKAIPAKQRIKEIEEGLKREFIETIQDPGLAEKLFFQLLKSANEEILIILSTVNTFLCYEKEGVLQLLIEAAERGVKLKIFVNLEKIIKEKVQKLLKEYSQIDVQYLDKSLQTKVTTLIVDRELSLVVELKDDRKETSNEAIGLAMYSNSKSTVSSYTSIFETLWMQAELNQQREKDWC